MGLLGRFGILPAVVVAMVATACSGGRSVEAYCGELEEGFARMASNAVESGESAPEQFVLVVRNVSEMNRLLSRLAAVAPDEIRPDVEAVAGSWERQGEEIGSAASNPLGGFAQMLGQSMLVSASAAATDAWTLENCGRTLFGSPPAELLAADGPVDRPIDRAEAVDTQADETEPPCPWLTDPITRDSKPGELRATLEAAASEGIDGASSIADRMAALDPPPETPWEAAGRLWWDGGNEPEQVMRTVDHQTQTDCGRPLLDEEFWEGFDELGPRPLGDGRIRVGSYGRPCSSSTWHGFWGAEQQPMTEDGVAILHCDDPSEGVGLTVHLVDMQTGVVSEVPVPERNAWTGRPGHGTWPWFTGGWMYWVEADEVDASGLDPARNRTQLFRAALESLSDTELLYVAEVEPGWYRNPDGPPASLEIVGAHEGRVLVVDTAREDVTLRIFDTDGQQTTESVGVGAKNPVLAWPGVVQYGEHVVDLRRATMHTVESVSNVTFPLEIWKRDACTGARFEHGGEFLQGRPLVRWEIDKDGLLSSTVISLDSRPPSGPLVPMANGLLAIPTRGYWGDWTYYSSSGDAVWELPGEVVDRGQVFDGQLFVMTVADELIAVDTATGEEGSADLATLAVAEALLDDATLWIDPTTGDAELRMDDDVQFLELEHCIPGAS